MPWQVQQNRNTQMLNWRTAQNIFTGLPYSTPIIASITNAFNSDIISERSNCIQKVPIPHLIFTIKAAYTRKVRKCRPRARHLLPDVSHFSKCPHQTHPAPDRNKTSLCGLHHGRHPTRSFGWLSSGGTLPFFTSRSRWRTTWVRNDCLVVTTASHPCYNRTIRAHSGRVCATPLQTAVHQGGGVPTRAAAHSRFLRAVP